MAYPALITDLTFIRRLLVVCEQAAWNTVNSDADPESDQSSDQIRKTKWKKQFLEKPHKALIYKEEPWPNFDQVAKKLKSKIIWV